MKRNTKLKGPQKDGEALVNNTKQILVDDGWGLSEVGFIGWCTQLARDNVCALWRAFLETGHDFRLDKVFSDANELTQNISNRDWTKEQDATLVTYVDQLAENLRITPQSIHPHEIYLEESAFLNPQLALLKSMFTFCVCSVLLLSNRTLFYF